MLLYIRKMTLITKLVIVLFLLNMADFITTKHMVNQYGFDIESNPILLCLMYQSGTVYAILYLKLLFFCLLIPALWINNERGVLTLKSIRNILGILCIFFIIIVTTNTFYIIGA